MLDPSGIAEIELLVRSQAVRQVVMQRISRRHRFLLFLLALILPAVSFAESQVGAIVGVLEHHHPGWPGWGAAVGSADENGFNPHVRVLFRKNGGRWVAFPHAVSSKEALEQLHKQYPGRITWNVVFDGRDLGRLVSKSSGPFNSYAEVGVQAVAAGQSVPVVGKPSREFADWTMKASPRPLMLVSNGSAKDPDAWKPSVIPKSLLKKAIPLFRKRRGPIAFCNQEYGDEATAAYSKDLIQVVKSYRSKAGSYLLGLRLDPVAFNCDYSEGLGSLWFHSTDGSVSYLGEGLTLVEAADFDQDGDSEIVFWLAAYNRNGYVLFYNDLSESASFSWSFH